MRVVLDLAYDGTRYRGWQKQKESSFLTVQGELEKALKIILDVEQIKDNKESSFVFFEGFCFHLVGRCPGFNFCYN